MPRRILEGKVVSDAQDKTITVLVERRIMHPLYKKYLKKSNKFSAHDENNTCKVGDIVSIQECRPISKNKSWTLITGGAEANAPKAKAEKPAAKKAAAPKKAEAKKEAKPAAAKKAPAKKAAAKKAEPKKAAAKKPAAKKATKKDEGDKS